MISDAELLFSDGQALTATAISANVYDSGPLSEGNLFGDLGTGTRLMGYIAVTTTFAAGTSVAFSFESDVVAALSTDPTVHWTSSAIAVADLVAGYRIPFVLPPPGKDALGDFGENYQRFSGFRYTVVGTPTAGAVRAVVVPAVSVDRDYASGLNFGA